MRHFLLFIALAFYGCASSSDIMQDRSLTFLALGDSYTIGESVAEDQRWPVQLAKKMTDNGIQVQSPRIIATTGWRTDQLKQAIDEANDLKTSYDMVSLLIGVNNQYQGRSVESFAPEFEELLLMAIAQAGGNKAHVFVVSIPDYGKTPFGAAKEEEIGKALDQYNAVSKEICEQYDIAYYDITPISREAKASPELVASDRLHPSGEMYRRWVDLFYQDVINQMKK